MSDEEFRKLHEVCVATGARSVSDLAREAMHQLTDGRGNGADRLGEMEERMQRLEAELGRLAAARGDGQ